MFNLWKIEYALKIRFQYLIKYSIEEITLTAINKGFLVWQLNRKQKFIVNAIGGINEIVIVHFLIRTDMKAEKSIDRICQFQPIRVRSCLIQTNKRL